MGGTMNNKWAILGLAATHGLAAGCNKGDSSTNPSTDSSQQGASQSADAQKPAPEPPRPIVVPAETPITVVLTSTISSKVASRATNLKLPSPNPLSWEAALPFRRARTLREPSSTPRNRVPSKAKLFWPSV